MNCLIGGCTRERWYDRQTKQLHGFCFLHYGKLIYTHHFDQGTLDVLGREAKAAMDTLFGRKGEKQ